MHSLNLMCYTLCTQSTHSFEKKYSVKHQAQWHLHHMESQILDKKLANTQCLK